MSDKITPRVGVFLLSMLALLFGAIGLSVTAEAAIEKNIVDSVTGTILGMIVLPTLSGSLTGPSPAGVTFKLNQFTQADITAISWDWNAPSLSLKAVKVVTGTSPCNGAQIEACSKKTLTLTLQSFSIGTAICQALPPPGQSNPGCTQQSADFPSIEFVDAAPAYACQGFEWPLDHGPVTVRRNLALPLKAELVDEHGSELRRGDLSALPVVQVTYQSGIGTTAEDVSDEVMSLGRGGDANTFVYFLGKWRFYLRVKNYSAPGTYTVSMVSGDETEYRFDPICEAQFVVSP
jgi:hypothetical protein